MLLQAYGCARPAVSVTIGSHHQGQSFLPPAIKAGLTGQGYPANEQSAVNRVNTSDSLEVLVVMTPERFSDSPEQRDRHEKVPDDKLRSELGIYADLLQRIRNP